MTEANNMHTIKSLLTRALVASLVTSAPLLAQEVEWQLQDGFTGVGTGSPAAKLHVVDAVDARLVVQNTEAGDASDKYMFELHNASRSKVRFAITSDGNNSWTFDNNPRQDWFSISKVGTGANEFIVRSNGDGIYRGSVTAAGFNNVSSREAKTGFANIDTRDVLARVAALPLSEWRYKTEDASARHVGPMAEDFQQVFDLGDGKTISTVDASGIVLAAIQGLKQEKDAQIAALQAELQSLKKTQEERVMQLELALARVIRDQSRAIKVISAR
jgi:hypothetical protein